MNNTSDIKAKKEKKTKEEKKLKKAKRDALISDGGETREEKRARKKIEKVAKVLGYSNDSNPFNDPNLLQPFVWIKKQEKDIREGKSMDVADAEEHRLNLIKEIERVRERRELRIKEQMEMERLRNEEQRLKDSANFGDWQQKEEDFHIDQIKIRSYIRMAEKRDKPIDLIAKNLLLLEVAESTNRMEIKEGAKIAHLPFENRDPHEIITILGDENILMELKEDAEGFLVHEQNKKSNKNKQFIEKFWITIMDIIQSEIANIRDEANAPPPGLQTSASSSSRLHKSLTLDVRNTLKGKTDDELRKLDLGISLSLNDGSYPVSEHPYWLKMQQEIKYERGKMYILEQHSNLISRKKQFIERLAEIAKMAAPFTLRADEVPENDGDKFNGGVEVDEEGDTLEQMTEWQEIQLKANKYSWDDKYRPRKPRYINRVRTGWDWNKYNQTHYDHDNPPPKTVQGYRFNIFYPDLINKAHTPKFVLENTSADGQFITIRFTAGPPYEDVAFQILNREWDIHRKAGFKSTFDRGILQLHFNFKRHRYRR